MDTFRRNYSMYKALINLDQNRDILDSFKRIVEATLYTSALSNFSTEQLSAEIDEKWGIQIPDLPLRNILGRLIENNALEKVKNRARYMIISNQKFRNTYEEMNLAKKEVESKFSFLISDYINFVNENFDSKVSREESIVEIESFLAENASSISLKKGIQNNRDHLRFSTYFIDRCLCNDELKSIIETVTFGYILSDSLLFTGGSSSANLINVDVVVDTPIIFKLFGIGDVDESSIYKKMIEELIRTGANLSIFAHCVDEVEQIIAGATQWVNNAEFDANLASQTALYFIDNGYTVADIEAVKGSLRNNINKMGIEIIDENFDKSVHSYIKDQDDIYDTINDVYKSRSYNYNDMGIRNSDTILLDSRSINQIYVMRKSSRSANLRDSRAFLLTSNSGLVYASKKFNDKINGDNRGQIPPCIKDVHLGTYVWLNNPVIVKEMGIKELINQAYQIMTPSTQLWAKFTNELQKAFENGDLSEDEVHFLRTSSYIRRDLVRVTEKNLDNVTYSIPRQLIDDIKQAGKMEVEKEFEIEKNKILESSQNELIEISSLKDAQINEKNEEIIKGDKKLEVANNKLTELKDRELKKKLSKFEFCVNFTVAIAYLGLIFVHILFMRDGFDWITFGSNFIGLSSATFAFRFLGKKNSENTVGFVYNGIKFRIISSVEKKYEILSADTKR